MTFYKIDSEIRFFLFFHYRMTGWPQAYPALWDAAYEDTNLTMTPFKGFALGFRNILQILGMVNFVIIVEEEQGISIDKIKRCRLFLRLKRVFQH